MTRAEAKKIIEKRIPEIKILSHSTSEDSYFVEYKGFEAVIYYSDAKYEFIIHFKRPAVNTKEAKKKVVKLGYELAELINAPTRQEAKEISNKIKSTSKKLPKKTMKLEDIVNA